MLLFCIIPFFGTAGGAARSKPRVGASARYRSLREGAMGPEMRSVCAEERGAGYFLVVPSGGAGEEGAKVCEEVCEEDVAASSGGDAQTMLSIFGPHSRPHYRKTADGRRKARLAAHTVDPTTGRQQTAEEGPSTPAGRERTVVAAPLNS